MLVNIYSDPPELSPSCDRLTPYTEVEVFLDKRVHETRQTAGANSRRGATKMREISQTLLYINIHFSVVCFLEKLRDEE